MMSKLTHMQPHAPQGCVHTRVETHTHTHMHTYCAGYIPYPVSPGGRPLTWGAPVVGGDMYSCLRSSPNTPAHTEKRQGRVSINKRHALRSLEIWHVRWKGKGGVELLGVAVRGGSPASQQSLPPTQSRAATSSFFVYYFAIALPFATVQYAMKYVWKKKWVVHNYMYIPKLHAFYRAETNDTT